MTVPGRTRAPRVWRHETDEEREDRIVDEKAKEAEGK
jgi:hypothetical protein